MRFCQDHWNQLRAAIDERGLTPFIAKNGEIAVQQVARQLQGDTGKATFDPLMSAHWAIAGNVNEFLASAHMNPLYLLSGGPEAPVEGYPGYEGRTWPRCPLCYINLAHEVSCTNQACRLPKVGGYDWMITRAADDALAQARNFGLVAPA